MKDILPILKKRKKSLNELTVEEKDQKLIRNQKNFKIFAYCFIILACMMLYVMYEWNQSNNKYTSLKYKCSEEVMEILREQNCSGSSGTTTNPNDLPNTIVKSINKMLDKIFELPYGFWPKFLVFLGIIYLFNVCFSLMFDIAEVFLMIGIGIWRGLLWIYRKIRSLK
jgi:hypothetical protein